jgi:3D (Asp-Asp-Asp) domain-containing protein
MSLWSNSKDALRAEDQAPRTATVEADASAHTSVNAPGVSATNSVPASSAVAETSGTTATAANEAAKTANQAAKVETPAASKSVSPPNSIANNLLNGALDAVQSVNPLAKLPQQAGRMLNVRAIVAGKTIQRRIMVPLKGASVGQALLKMGIELGPLDRVSPVSHSNAANNMTVRVERVTAPIKKRRVSIAPETRYQPTTAIRVGAKQLVKAGKPGTVEITERVWSLNGRVSRREVISKRVIARAQPKLVGLGSRSAYMPGSIPYHKRYARSFSLSSRSGSPRDRFGTNSGTSFRAEKSIMLVATGYSPDPRENGGYTTTATGLPIGYGAAAVDPRVIPLGTKLYVEGYGYAFACDVGGAIKGHRIDLAYDSYRLANTKGRKKVRVWILGR